MAIPHLSDNQLPSVHQLDLTFDAVALADAIGPSQPKRSSSTTETRDTRLDERALLALMAATGVEPQLIQQIVSMALAFLHKEALLNEQDVHGTLIRCYREFGTEACYHLNGILVEGLRHQGSVESLAAGWADTVALVCPFQEWKPLNSVVETWLTERTKERREMDKSLEDDWWQQELEDLQRHPEVNPNGQIYLESLQGRPTFVKGLIRSGGLLQEVLDRQKVASDYVEHMVLTLHQDPELSQMEAEREFLRVPDEATSPDLNNWDAH